MGASENIVKENYIRKYIEENGHKCFGNLSFTNMDNIVLCQLSYVDFAEILSKGESITLKEALHRFKEVGNCDLKMVWGENQGFDFLLPCATSERFGNIVISSFSDFVDRHTGMQFCAMSFVFDDCHEYIAFRGTDETIVGWKECLELSYGYMPSHEYALKYLEKHINLQKKYFVGGHSKGGNLALYAASKISEDKFRRIDKVFANDSPGFYPKADIFDIGRLQKKLISIRPEDSFVGRIFELKPKNDIIVKCSESGLKQHYLQTWKFQGTELVKAEHFSHLSNSGIAALNIWLSHNGFDERMKKIDDLYNAMTKEGSDTIEEFFDEGTEGYERVLNLHKKALGIFLGGMISGIGMLILIVKSVFKRDKQM